MGAEGLSVDLAAARRRLDAERARIDRVVEAGAGLEVATLDDGAELSTVDQHPADSASDVTERETVAALRRTSGEHMARLDAAVARLEAGTYGICEVGGEVIEPERLDAVPVARTCIAHREQEASLPIL